MKNLKELTRKRIYRIPDYQRGYSWEKRQIDELIDDIENIRLNNELSYHFTGIVSYSEYNREDFNIKESTEINEDDEIEIYHIADGQQRMTTLYILLFEVYKKLYPNNFQSKFLDSILTYSFNDKRIYRFGYDVDVPSREYLYNIIFEDSSYQITHPETLYTSNLDFAKQAIQIHLSELEENHLKLFKRKLEQRLLFQEFLIDTSKLDVSMVFETMNYRGKSLSKLELFKNRLIYLVGAKYTDRGQVDNFRRHITNAWLKVYSWLGKKSDLKLNDDAFLTAYTIIHFENRNTKDSEFKNIIDRIFQVEYPIKGINTNKNLEETSLFYLTESIEIAVKCFFITFNPFSVDPEVGNLNIPFEIKRQIFIINQIGGANYIKTLICCALVKFIQLNFTNLVGLQSLLLEIEKHQLLVFNLLGRKIDANRPDIYRLCNELYVGNVTFAEARQKIKQLTLKFWESKNYIKMIQDNLNKEEERFLKIPAFRVILFLKEVYDSILPNEILKFNDFTLSLVFPNDHGSNAKFPNVVRQREPKNISYLRYSLGNIIITQRNLVFRGNISSPNYFQQRIQNLELSKIAVNKLISQNIQNWSDVNILDRGIEIFKFLKNRYDLTQLTDDDIRHILVDDLRIQGVND